MVRTRKKFISDAYLARFIKYHDNAFTYMLWNLLIGSILLGSVHAAIPNHWLPVVLIGRAEGWSERETLGVVALSGFFHTLSTVVLGIVIGAIGMEVSERLEDQTRLIASLLLVFMGLIYFAMHDANAG